jgi:hypothetical protein
VQEDAALNSVIEVELAPCSHELSHELVVQPVTHFASAAHPESLAQSRFCEQQFAFTHVSHVPT